MKASQVVEMIQEAIRKYGDLPLVVGGIVEDPDRLMFTKINGDCHMALVPEDEADMFGEEPY